MSLRSRTNPLPPRARRAAGIAAFAVAYFLLAELGRALVAPAGVAVLWPVSGLYLGVLLAVDRRRWPMFGAAALLASVAANLAAGSTPTTSLAFALPSCAEGLLAAAAVERLAGGRVSFARGRDVVALVVGGAVAANALTALGGALVARAAFSAPIGEIWLQWWSANGLGMLALAPLIAGPVARGRRVRSKRRLAELALLAAGLAGAVLLVFGADSLTGGLRSVLPGALALPFLLWSGWRFGPRTTVVASLALAAAAGYLTVQDRGPFSAGAASAEAKVLALQAFLAVALVASLAFAAAAGERRRAQTLRERLRRALEAAPDAYVAIDHDGRVVDWSSRAEGLFGWSRDEALGRPLLATVVPESSQAAVAAALESEGRGDASVAGPVRFDGRRRTGEELSLEATLASTDGAAEGSHVFLRDVSERERLRAELVDARESKEHTEHALHDAAAERDRLAEALEGVRRGLDQTRADLAGVTAERDGLGERLTRSEAERERLRAALGRAESAGERLRGELERLDRERTELEQERARLAGEIELLARHLEERTHERDAARHGLEQSDRKGAQLSEELARAGEERAALRRDLELMAAKSDGLRVEAQKLAAQRDRLQQELEEASRQRDGLRSELETSHAERGRLEAKLRDAAAQHESLRQELRAGSARRRQLEGELGSVTARRQELEASLAASRQESEAIRHRLRRQTADQERLMQQLQREGEARGGAEQALDAIDRKSVV